MLRTHRGRLALACALAGVAAITALLLGLGAHDHAHATARTTAQVPAVKEPGPGAVDGYLYADRNGNRRQDADEPPLGSWTVKLFSTGPLPLQATRSRADGTFDFGKVANLAAGTTSVRLQMMPILEGPAATALPDSSALSESVTVAIGRPSAVPVSSFRLCLTLAECPSLKLPDLKPILTSNGGDEYPPPTATRVDTTTKPGRVLLRFASSNVNLGGLLHLVADPVQTGATRRGVRQLVYGHGVVYVREAGQFVYHPAHHHFHVGDFERYELLSANRTRVLRTSAKISFCLTDIQNIAAPARTDGSLYLDLPPLQCGAQEQGINSGFADYYGRELPDQWIDMTGLPAGTYWVRIRANPSRLLLEADTANNSTEFRVTYHGPGA